MPLTLITGPANSGKARLVMETMGRHLAHGGEPLLVVPTRADTQHYMRELAGSGVAMGARVARFSELIDELVRRAGAAPVALGRRARRQLLAAVVGEQQGATPGEGLLDALEQLIDELESSRVSPERFLAAIDRWAEADAPSAAPRELGELFRGYARALHRIGRVDSERQASLALDELRRRPHLWGGTPVLFYGFDDLTPLQLDAIETLGAVVGAPVTVSLAYESGRVAFAGRAATFEALRPLASEHVEREPRADHYAPAARVALSALERSLFEPGAEPVDPGGTVRAIEAAGPREELQLVAGEIARLIAAGIAPEDIAVVMRADAATQELVREVFASAGIAIALPRRRPLRDTAIGGALLGLLRSVDAAGEPAELLAWLGAPGLLAQPLLADRLELRVRRSGADSVTRARELWEERNWPLDALERVQQAQHRGPLALLDAVTRELERLLAAPRTRAASVLDGEELEDARAVRELRVALGELRELARLHAPFAPANAAALAAALERLPVPAGETPRRGLVPVLDPLELRARRVRALFLCSLQEGSFPSHGHARGMLADEERRRLRELAGISLREREDTLAAERYLFYASVSRPEELLVLSWHVSDDDGRAAGRSLFVDDVYDVLGELRRAADPGGARNGRASAAVPPARAPAGVAPAPIAPLREPSLLASLRERVWSASSLELWIGCPVRWFVERMLTPAALDPDPEPLARGGLAHAVLKDVLEGLRSATGSARVEPGTLPLACELLERALAEREREFPLSVLPERGAGVRRRLHADLERYLQHAAAAASPLEPRELELGFGFEKDDPRGEDSTLPPFEFAPGVMLRGRIDRLDVGARGEAVVYDYKGREAPGAARWAADGNLQVALYMGAAEQLLGVRVAGGFYQPLTGQDLRARGVLDGDSGVELECVRGEVLEHAEMRELLAATLQTARDAAEQARCGALEPRPRSCSYQGGCAYPTICRCEQ